MNNILTQLQIDLYSSTSYEVIKAQQGDKNSRVIEFVLYSQGEPYEFSDNIFFRFVGHRGDGSSFSKTEEECITRNGNHVSVTLPEDVLYYDGIIEAKLVIYEPTVKSAKSNLTDKLPEKPERTVLSTIPFKISCIKNPCNENDLSEGEVSIVTDLIFQMEEFSKNAQDIIDDAQNYATLAQSYAVGGTGERENEENDNAMHYYNQTKLLESSAKESKDAAKTSELNAAGSASSSNVSATTATQKANDASTYAKQAQSYALGTGNARPDERTDNAKYYCEEAWNAYHLLEQAGNVTGVKGDAEKNYHTGNVSLSPEAIGAHSASYINQNFIAGYVSHKRKLIAGSGWFRIATLKTNGNGSSACTIKLSRTYNYGSPEYQEIKLFKAYNTYKFVAVNAFCAQYWSQIRLVKCEDEKYYVDIYNSNTQGDLTGQNEWDVLVENDGMIYPWEAMEAKLVDSSDTGELITSLNLPANLDAGNYLQNGEQIPVVGKTGYIAYPTGAYYQVASNSVTGYIGIALPVSWTNTFLRFTVSIFNMGTGESCDYHISGYNYASTPTWSNCTAVCVGKAGSVHSNLPVRFGHNGTKCIICIGETSTKWIYPVVQVHDVVLGYNSRDFDTWKSGWDIHFYTGLPGTVNFLIPTTHVANGGVAGSCTGNAATATKATQDGDGNNIVNTYAKSSIYKDGSISLGRKANTSIGVNCAAIGNDAMASNDYSFAAGDFAASTNYSSSALGKMNKTMTTGGSYHNQVGDALVVGNGYYYPPTSTINKSNALRVTYQGDILGTKAFQSSGADYAENVKPWADGNPNNEDRVGYMVTVKEGLLYKAQPGDYVAGITSGNPSVIGNADEDYYWKYVRDEFNRIVMEDVPEIVQQTDNKGNLIFDKETHEPVMTETGNIIKNARMKLSESYDPSLQDSYIPRAERQEWDYVGMRGIIPVRDDGTCLRDHFCKCGQGGIATLAEKRDFDTFYVLERISENVVSVLV